MCGAVKYETTATFIQALQYTDFLQKAMSVKASHVKSYITNELFQLQCNIKSVNK